MRQAEDKDAFLEAWGKLDPLATGRLPVHQLVEMVHSMPPPLGMDPADFPFRQVSRSSVLAYLLQARLIPRPRCLPALPSAAHRTPRNLMRRARAYYLGSILINMGTTRSSLKY